MDKVEHIAMTRGGLCQTSTCHREDNGQLYLDSLINISMRKTEYRPVIRCERD